MEFEKEEDRWVDEGILVPWKEKIQSGILLLMLVNQPAKHKVRPVLDIRELNTFVSCHTECDDIDVRGTMRDWRQTMGAAKIVDQKSACLQLHVAEKAVAQPTCKLQGDYILSYQMEVWVERRAENHGGSTRDCSEAGGKNRTGHKLLY